jgi:hypothetical protein
MFIAAGLARNTDLHASYDGQSIIHSRYRCVATDGRSLMDPLFPRNDRDNASAVFWNTYGDCYPWFGVLTEREKECMIGLEEG